MKADREPGSKTGWQRGVESGAAIVIGIAALKLLLHVLTAGRYGYFRDELYHIACSEHLDWGYVDQPPLIAVVTWFTRWALGDSLVALRFFPALAGAGMVALTAMLARQFGGRRFAMGFAGLSISIAGIYLVMEYLLTMNAFEPLFVAACALLLVRMIQTGNTRLWLWFGVLAGLGLQNKYSMLVFGLGMVGGLLLTPQRRLLASKWLWVGGGISVLIILPNVLWNMSHGWPFVEFMRNVKASGRDIALSPFDYMLQQVLIINPIQAPIWIVGLFWMFWGRAGRRYRALGWAYVIAAAVFIMLKGKNYYLAPAYPMLLAAGAVALEQAVERSTRRRWLKPATTTALLAESLAFLPLVLPVLSVEGTVAYLNKLPFQLPRSEHSHVGAALPQYFADQFGWEEMTSAVATAWSRLTPEERERACIGASNYGEAGAIDFFGRKYGLPKAISPHQNYFLWGPRDCGGEILILLGKRPQDMEGMCDQVEMVAELHHPFAILFENRPVLVCRRSRSDLREIWPRLKVWN